MDRLRTAKELANAASQNGKIVRAIQRFNNEYPAGIRFRFEITVFSTLREEIFYIPFGEASGWIIKSLI